MLMPGYALARDERLDLWFNKARIGMIFTWGMGTFPKYATVADFEAAANRDGWTAKVVIDQAKKMHAKYLIWITFHVEMGQLATWKTTLIPNRTQRDFLGEVLAEAKKEDIKILVYFNPGVQPAYLTELFTNYPDIGGAWFDWWNSDLDSSIPALRQNFPDKILAINNWPWTTGEMMDYFSSEDVFRKFLRPYDYTSGCYVRIGPGGEALPRLLNGGWQYDGNDVTGASAVEQANQFRKMVSAIGCSWNMCWALP